jgi:hypothetical protein
MTIGTLIGIAASASVLAQSAARKRGRSPQAWGVLAFLFPVALVVLWCLKARQDAAGPVPAAAKTPVDPGPSGWADSQLTSGEQHAVTSGRGMSATSLAESW